MDLWIKRNDLTIYIGQLEFRYNKQEKSVEFYGRASDHTDYHGFITMEKVREINNTFTEGA